MPIEEMIPVNDFCTYHNIPLSFIYSLNESGLINITSIDKELLVPISQLKHLEKMVLLSKEMEINAEGAYTIIYLLQRIVNMQQHILELDKKLACYQSS